MSRRTSLLATVHVARKELGWDDDTYRDVVRRCTGKYSAGDCSDAQLRSMLEEFKRLGFQIRPGAKAPRPLSKKAQVRMAYAIWGDIKPHLEGEVQDAALRGFVQRQTRSEAHPDGVSALEFCDQANLTKVIEGLKGWRARLQKKREAA